MTFKKLVKELAKRETGKKQVDIAQMTEIVSHLADIVYEMDHEQEAVLIDALWFIGEKRANKREREARKK
jgi:hypothetical protein